MAEVKLTKMELRAQQLKLEQLKKYLPTLQMKKSMLQLEVSYAALELKQLTSQLRVKEKNIKKYVQLFTDPRFDQLLEATRIKNVEVFYDNIAGISVPKLKEVDFEETHYSLFDTPLWFESVLQDLKELLFDRERKNIAQQKKLILENELKEVSIRVNLFEKILIPRSQENIKKIKIFLNDQQLAAVSQAKVAKKKILHRFLKVGK